MTKPLQERMSITLDELKELEPGLAKIPIDTAEDFEWIATRLYLTAYAKGYVNGGIDMGDRIEARLSRSIKVKK